MPRAGRYSPTGLRKYVEQGSRPFGLHLFPILRCFAVPAQNRQGRHIQGCGHRGKSGFQTHARGVSAGEVIPGSAHDGSGRSWQPPDLGLTIEPIALLLQLRFADLEVGIFL